VKSTIVVLKLTCSAVAMAALSFAGTLEKEGRELNIKANSIVPSAVTRLSASSLLWKDSLKAEWVVPLVANLAHSTNERSGHVLEAGSGHFGRVRWEQNEGLCLPADENLMPDAVLQEWSKLRDFTQGPRYLDGAEWIGDRIEKVKNLPKGESAPEKVDFRGRVVLVTGGAQGLGRSYCYLLAKLGAIVAVNDLNPVDTATVVKDIKDKGGEAISVNVSVEQGDLVVKKVVDTYGRIDAVINNAGITRDLPFDRMNDKSWFDVINCHLTGTYKISKAAWPYMVKQGYGRFVNTISAVGLYGNWHQANYSSAKGAIIGLTKVMAREGLEHNIHANCVGPYAFTNMLKQYMGEEMGAPLAPEWVAALSVLLVSDEVPSDKTGQIYEAGCGWFAAVRLQRSKGVDLCESGVPTPEEVAKASISTRTSSSVQCANRPSEYRENLRV
jgi:multifunctional beta-oxidation protein